MASRQSFSENVGVMNENEFRSNGVAVMLSPLRHKNITFTFYILIFLYEEF